MPKLKRSLGLFEATTYGVGIILGAGIYALIGKAAGAAGNVVWMAFGLAAVIAALTGLSYAELSSAFPKEAAEYVYAKKAFKSNKLAFLLGWLIIFTGCVAIATVSLGFAGYFSALFGVPIIPAAAALILILSFLNFLGIKQSSNVNIVFTAIELLGLLIIIFLGLSFFGSVNYFEAPAGFNGIFAAAILIFFAYLGFEDIVNVSEETKKPTKTIPKALLLSVVITSIIYILVSISAVSILPWQTLGESSAPLADVAGAALPGSGFLLSVIALFATANTVLILLIVESRMMWGMACDCSLPKILSKVHLKRKTPYIAIFVAMGLALAFTALADISIVAKITDVGAFIIFFSVNMSLIWLRLKKPRFKAPFRVPINIKNFPVLAGLGAVFCAFMLFQFELILILFVIGVLISGVIAYKFINRGRQI